MEWSRKVIDLSFGIFSSEATLLFEMYVLNYVFFKLLKQEKDNGDLFFDPLKKKKKKSSEKQTDCFLLRFPFFLLIIFIMINII